MPAVPDPITSPARVDRPAAGAFAFIFTRLPALLRLSCGLFCLAVALAVRTPPVRVELLLPTVAVLTGWSVWYALRAWRDGVGAPVVAVDVTLTSAACLAIPVLVAPEVLPGEASWIAVLASTTVINAQATAPARLSVPAGLLVTVAYATGAHLAGNSTEARAHAATLLAQTACTAMMTAVMRRRIVRADTAFVAAQRAARHAMVARIAREAERQQNRDLHDTVLATLTMVGQGAVAGPSTALRERCAADLRTLAALAEARSVPHDATARLDERLRTMLARLPGLPVAADLPPCTVSAPVAEAVAESAHAALANVANHAPGARATLRLRQFAGALTVDVTDDGPGFDPATVPAHRYGLRESVRGRMETIGGRADIDSAPGRGTRIRLEWSDVG
ncbi:sensor histidine kinase [Micromonospora andamanensis]|uniref:Histidine kinase n=1 Tax=Micromonospora andamanensis TaxID=1287068 RepID=A0ABQ4HZY5_9ACTN|nr:ATP-binding protein [Micromonospora andamanensis]GIJ11180.1 histidine kinase [Micromonospora andamanensis]